MGAIGWLEGVVLRPVLDLRLRQVGMLASVPAVAVVVVAEP
jgi:hypothetical protein